MIGQDRLRSMIDTQLDNGKFPQFVILTGARGCGKRTLVNHIVIRQQFGYSHIPTTVDGIREMIEFIGKGGKNLLFGIYDIDNLSQAGCNALLKIAEEPPKDVYIIATCENIENVPTTIRSRAVVYQFDEYTESEMCDFCDERGYKVDDFTLSTCYTLGDIEILNKYDVEEFKNFIDLVINNIASVSGANAFKIADKVCLKGDEGYDLKLFLMAFSSACVDYMLNKDINNCLKFSKAVAITGNAIADLNVKAVNKQMLFDKWLLDIRSAWS